MSAQSPIRTFLLDRHDIVRLGVRSVLTAAQGIEVAGEATTAAEGTEAILRAAPDVALIDAKLGDESGIEVCIRVREADPSIKTFILTNQDDDATLASAILAGASAFMAKEISGQTLVAAVRRVASNENVIDPARAMRALERKRAQVNDAVLLATLTEQERRILPLLGEGLTNKEIGAQLFLAEKTVRNHVTRILAKLGVRGRTQAALMASRNTED